QEVVQPGAADCFVAPQAKDDRPFVLLRDAEPRKSDQQNNPSTKCQKKPVLHRAPPGRFSDSALDHSLPGREYWEGGSIPGQRRGRTNTMPSRIAREHSSL